MTFLCSSVVRDREMAQTISPTTASSQHLAFCLTLRKEFARADSKCGMTGICCSSAPGMDTCGTSYSQRSLESSDPFPAGVERWKPWISSSACVLMGSTCHNVCTQVPVLASVSFCNADISDAMFKKSSHLFGINLLIQMWGF